MTLRADTAETMRVVNQASLSELLPGVRKQSVLGCFSMKHKPATAFLPVGDEEKREH